LNHLYRKQTVFFNELLDNFEKATPKNGNIKKKCFKIGGKLICTIFACEKLDLQLTPALEHSKTNYSKNPDLTIYLWDSATTNTKMVDSPWQINDYNIHGKVNGYNSDRFQTGVSMVSGALSMTDLKNNIAAWWTYDADNILLNERAEPIMSILNWWFSSKGLHFMHAGAVGNADGGALLLGLKGSGKSTISIASISSSLKYAGDDYCLISENNSPIVYSLYNTVKLNPKSIKLIKNINISKSHAIRYTDEKSIFFLNQLFSDKIINSFPAKAVILPYVNGKGQSSLDSISSFEAIKVIGPNTLFQFSGSKQKSFNAVVNLVKRIPCYRLSIGSDPMEANRLILNVL
jgi:hypothetical protein